MAPAGTSAESLVAALPGVRPPTRADPRYRRCSPCEACWRFPARAHRDSPGRKKRTTKACWRSRESRRWSDPFPCASIGNDFFALLRLRGESKVFVAVYGSEVVGSRHSAALRTAYLSGIPELVAYIGDLKSTPDSREAEFRFALTALRADLNRSGRRAFVSQPMAITGCYRCLKGGSASRVGIPAGRSLVDGLPLALSTGARNTMLWKAAQRSDVSAIALLLDCFHKSRQFAPQLQEDEIAAALFASPELPFTKTSVGRARRRIVATTTLCDIDPLKRNVFLNAPGTVKAALAVLRGVAVPFLRFPDTGEEARPSRLLNVRHFACEEGHEASPPLLVSLACAEACNRFTFLMLGLHERDPLRSLVRRIPRLTFSRSPSPPASGTWARLEELCRGIPLRITRWCNYALIKEAPLNPIACRSGQPAAVWRDVVAQALTGELIER